MKRGRCVVDVVQINHAGDEQGAENRRVVVLEEFDDEVVDELTGQRRNNIRLRE